MKRKESEAPTQLAVRSQSSRKRGRDSSENATLKAARLKTSHSPASGHQYSPTGHQSATSIMAKSGGLASNSASNGPFVAAGKGAVVTHGDATAAATRLRFVSESNFVALEQQQQQQPINVFPLTVFPPAKCANSESNNSSGSAFAITRSGTANKSSAKSPAVCNSSGKIVKNNAASQGAAKSINNNRLEHDLHYKQTRSNGGPANDDMLVVSALRRQQMKDAFQPWVMQVYSLFMSHTLLFFLIIIICFYVLIFFSVYNPSLPVHFTG